MKAILLALTVFAWGAIPTAVDPTPARIKLSEVLAEIQKNQVECLKGGTKPTECETKKQDELYANGMPRDWFEKGEKEYQEFWAKQDKVQKK